MVYNSMPTTVRQAKDMRIFSSPIQKKENAKTDSTEEDQNEMTDAQAASKQLSGLVPAKNFLRSKAQLMEIFEALPAEDFLEDPNYLMKF